MPDASFLQRIRGMSQEQATYVAALPPDHPVQIVTEEKTVTNEGTVNTGTSVVTVADNALLSPSTATDDASVSDLSPAWRDLLGKAYLVDGEDPGGLWQALLGLARLGAVLEPVAEGGVSLRAGAIDDAEYRALRACWLVPNGGTLRLLLAEVRG